MAPRTFTFINRTESSVLARKGEDDDIPTIRSHAMTEVRRRRRQRQSPEIDVAAGAKIYPSSTTKNKDGDRRHPSAFRSLVPSMGHSRAFSSPYCGTAIEGCGSSIDLSQSLDYFITGFTPCTFPTTHVRHTCDVLRIAASEGNPALLHALCAISTIHRALKQNTTTADASTLIVANRRNKTDHIFLYHKQRAINLLQTHLSTHVRTQSRSVLAIVVILLLIESFSGDTVVINLHRSGLSELAKQYNALQESSDLLIADILMSDIKSAASSLSRPAFSPCDEWVQAFDMLKYLPFDAHRSDLVSLGSGFMMTEVDQNLSPDLVLLMYAMRNLVNAVEQNFDVGIDGSAVNGIHILMLEHQLLSVKANVDGDNLPGTGLGECCRIGALIYCNLCLWNWPKNATLTRNLVSYFRTAILRWTAQTHIHEQYRVLLWLYFIGSFATSDTSIEEYRWYLRGMDEVSKRLKIEDRDHFRDVLASFFYVDRLMAQHLTSCYTDMCLTSQEGG